MKRRLRIALYGLMGFVLTVGMMAVYQGYNNSATAQDWRTASREPVGLAPDPEMTPEAVVQVYAARAWSWRGNFGVHTWIAAKPSGAECYTVYEVIGWRLRWGNSPVAIHHRAPDARWFGNVPELLSDLRGPGVDAIIGKVGKAARAYPFHDRYTV